MPERPKNVMDGPLRPCCVEPATGFHRDGYCRAGPQDIGAHVICAQMTDAFLRFSQRRGNDLSTPHPERGFPGLRAGDKWCLCALRWKEALDAGCAPPVHLEACGRSALEHVTLAALLAHAVEQPTIH